MYCKSKLAGMDRDRAKLRFLRQVSVWPRTLGTDSGSCAKCLASDTGESGPANLISLDLDSDGKHLAMGPAKDTKTHPKRHKCVEFYLGFQSKSFQIAFKLSKNAFLAIKPLNSIWKPYLFMIVSQELSIPAAFL
jgi:hypothetical protein